MADEYCLEIPSYQASERRYAQQHASKNLSLPLEQNASLLRRKLRNDSKSMGQKSR